MVVVAIIGILASLLLPALGKARKTAQQAVCLSKIKQLALAISMYADDNENFAPDSISNATNYGQWYGRLANYNYLSSTDTSYRSCPNGVAFTETYQSNVAINTFLSVAPAVSLDSSHTSETMLLMDNYNKNWAMWVAALRNELLIEASSETRISRHNNKSNVLFIDGHGQALSSTYLSTQNYIASTFWTP